MVQCGVHLRTRRRAERSCNRAGSLRGRGYLRPRPTLGRASHRFEQPVDGYPVIKVGMKPLLAGEGLEEIGKGCDKRVFVPDNLSWRPETAHIGMPRTGYQHLVAAFDFNGIASVKDLQPVQVFEVEANRTLRPVDFEGITVAASGGEASGFKCADAAVGEPCEQQGCVIDFTIGNESVEEAAHLLDPSVEQQG